MAKVKLTAGRITDFKCDEGKAQSFLWCADVPGLGVRATAGSSRKRYIFQAKVKGKSMRVTIGDVSAWGIDAAQVEARRLQTMIDQGNDPRQVKADKEAAKEAEKLAKEAKAAALVMQGARESVTVGAVWLEYIEARKAKWGAHALLKHERAMQRAGQPQKRGKELTVAGELESLADVRLVDLTPERVNEWASAEVLIRASSARLALKMLRAFLFWCARHHNYKSIITSNAATSPEARETLGKQKVKNDALQREQLPAWFAAVKSIGNPVISAFLQTLLIVGARREEWASLRWDAVDFQWNSIRIKDKVEDFRIIPLTPYVAHLLAELPRRNEFVFSSPASISGYLAEPSDKHNEACAVAGVDVTLHGLRRSFATLSEWIEMPAGIAAQIQGHAPQGVREQHYIRRPLDLLRMWHVKIEAWILEQAGIEFVPVKARLQLVGGK
ncbi:MAG: integrase family protein [Nitrosomonadales bacterium]|nr:integrase family protein [Nitrosomonadales bacterium]